jgi:hypothetical protein
VFAFLTEDKVLEKSNKRWIRELSTPATVA